MRSLIYERVFKNCIFGIPELFDFGIGVIIVSVPFQIFE